MSHLKTKASTTPNTPWKKKRDPIDSLDEMPSSIICVLSATRDDSSEGLCVSYHAISWWMMALT